MAGPGLERVRDFCCPTSSRAVQVEATSSISLLNTNQAQPLTWAGSAVQILLKLLGPLFLGLALLAVRNRVKR
jgi:hypothetical protein